MNKDGKGLTKKELEILEKILFHLSPRQRVIRWIDDWFELLDTIIDIITFTFYRPHIVRWLDKFWKKIGFNQYPDF